MLTNAIQAQNLLDLNINKNLSVIDTDMNARHKHYMSAEVNDSNWFNLTVSLIEIIHYVKINMLLL